MASFLKELTLALGLLTSDQSPVPNADGWQDYVWRIRDAGTCLATDARGLCHLVHDRWDWKREQWYDLSFGSDPKRNLLNLRLRIDNRDPSDQDRVCVVVLFIDDKDEEVAVYYSNWLSFPRRVIDRTTPLKPARDISTIAKVAVGSKQCDGASPRDADLYMRTRYKLDQR